MPATDVQDGVWAALQEIPDPEIPSVSIVELGIINGVHVSADGRVTVRATPTFVGCPALTLIGGQIRERVAQLAGVADVAVEWEMDPPWTTERITPAGRAKLTEYGIAPPPRPGAGLLELTEVPSCPYCGSDDTHMENVFGPTACRSIFYCASCRNPFEAMKPV